MHINKYLSVLLYVRLLESYHNQIYVSTGLQNKIDVGELKVQEQKEEIQEMRSQAALLEGKISVFENGIEACKGELNDYKLYLESEKEQSARLKRKIETEKEKCKGNSYTSLFSSITFYTITC